MGTLAIEPCATCGQPAEVVWCASGLYGPSLDVAYYCRTCSYTYMQEELDSPRYASVRHRIEALELGSATELDPHATYEPWIPDRDAYDAWLAGPDYAALQARRRAAATPVAYSRRAPRRGLVATARQLNVVWYVLVAVVVARQLMLLLRTH